MSSNVSEFDKVRKAASKPKRARSRKKKALDPVVSDLMVESQSAASGGAMHDIDAPDTVMGSIDVSDPVDPSQSVEIVVAMDGADGAPRMLDSGTLEIPNADGGLTFDFAPMKTMMMGASKHFDNLAGHIDEMDLGGIAEDLLTGIDADNRSRAEWLSMRATGLDLLGLRIEKAKSGVADGAAPLEGMSSVRHPLLAEAVIRFQSNARAELLPSAGPVKVRNDSDDDSAELDKLADVLERDLNHYLTVTAKEYYPDTDRLLFQVGFSGCAFKKLYSCPIRRRPVSEGVDAKDLIISDAATDLANASRVTHVITMRPAVMKRMQLLGVYRNIDLTPPSMPVTNAIDNKIASIQGVARPSRMEDQPYEIYECYCELDIPGFEHKQDGEASGLPLPYRVTLEKTSRQILEIRRNWNEDDDTYTAKKAFVKFPFVDAVGFYSVGLLHMLGNTTNALTAAWRELLDAGMFANFPGFLYAKSATNRQTSNEFRVAPGQGVPIDTGGLPIGQVIQNLPYKSPDAGLMSFVGMMESAGSRFGGTAETAVGEGVQNAPVGTTIALIEQSTKIMSAVHKRLHAAQAEEFQKLKELFREDPEALWRHNKRAARYWNPEKFIAALDQVELVPCSDPNTPSHMHRMAKAEAFRSIVAQVAPLFDIPKAVIKYMDDIGITDGESYFASGAPHQPEGQQIDPNKAIDAHVKMADQQVKVLDIKQRAQDALLDAQGRNADRQSKETIAGLQFARQAVVHPGAVPIIEQQLGSLRPLIDESIDQSGMSHMSPMAPTPPAQGFGGIPIGMRPPNHSPNQMSGQIGRQMQPQMIPHVVPGAPVQSPLGFPYARRVGVPPASMRPSPRFVGNSGLPQ